MYNIQPILELLNLSNEEYNNKSEFEKDMINLSGSITTDEFGQSKNDLEWKLR